MRLLILLFVTISMVYPMMFMGGNQGPKKVAKGDWPVRFPQHPAGFDYKCKNRKFGTVTLPPSSPIQQVQKDVKGDDVVTTPKATTPSTTTTTTTVKPTTTTVKSTSTTTLKQILTSPTTTTQKTVKPLPSGTTFWIRSPTPPNTPSPVIRGGAAYSLGPPQIFTVKIDSPFAPDAALDPLNGADSGGMDFNIKPVGIPKAPRAVIDPDA